MKDTKAVIDIGTNSVKYCLARMTNGKLDILEDRSTVTCMGEALASRGVISEAAFERNLKHILALIGDARASGIKELIICGTMWLRTAKNAEDFNTTLEKASGYRIRKIRGQEEAKLSFMAAQTTMNPFPRQAFLFDIGGGSTEIIKAREAVLEESLSLNLGVVVLTERFLHSDPVSPQEYRLLSGFVQRNLARVLPRGEDPVLIGIGGSFTSLASVFIHHEEDARHSMHGCPLSMSEVKRQIELYTGLSIEARKSIPGLNPARAGIILTGALMAEQLMQLCGNSEIRICAYGMRHGLLLEAFDKAPKTV